MDRLYLQLCHTPPTFLEGTEAVDVEPGGQTKLVGCQPTPETGKTVGPGERLSLTLCWQAMAAVNTDHTVLVHLSDSKEQIW